MKFLKNVHETEDIEHALPLNSHYNTANTHKPLKVVSTWPMWMDFDTGNLNGFKFSWGTGAGDWVIGPGTRW